MGNCASIAQSTPTTQWTNTYFESGKVSYGVTASLPSFTYSKKVKVLGTLFRTVCALCTRQILACSLPDQTLED